MQLLSPVQLKSNFKRPLRSLAASLIVIILYCYVKLHLTGGWGELLATDDPCENFPLSTDVFVAVRTGATEIREKLPGHLNAALQCLPNFAIFSDLNETFLGHQVHDVLDEVDLGIRRNHKDFDIYRKLQEKGAAGVFDKDLRVSMATANNGKFSNAAWVLDKWKFLPMVDRVLRMRPDVKWYVIIEADTYVVWPNLFRWLSTLDASKPEYVGSPMQAGQNIFAYGGSGIILSKAAAQKCSDTHLSHISDWNERTDRDWCGDCVLGNIMRESEVPLRGSWPLSYPGSIAQVYPTEERDGRRLWCHPVVALHHMQPKDVRDLWLFEREWARLNQGHLLLYKDVFRHYILPRLRSFRASWDNLSQELLNATSVTNTFDACEKACQSKPSCLQFAVSESGCRISSKAMLGRASTGSNVDMQSGWLLDRINLVYENIKECNEAPWV